MEIHVYPVQIDRFCVQSTTGVELMRERESAKEHGYFCVAVGDF